MEIFALVWATHKEAFHLTLAVPDSKKNHTSIEKNIIIIDLQNWQLSLFAKDTPYLDPCPYCPY